MGPEDTLHSGWGNVLAPLSGKEREGPHQATFNFPKRLSNYEGLGGTLSCGCILTPETVHSTDSTEMLHAWYWLCLGGDYLCLTASRLEFHWALGLPRVVISPSGQMGTEDTVYS